MRMKNNKYQENTYMRVAVQNDNFFTLVIIHKHNDFFHLANIAVHTNA